MFLQGAELNLSNELHTAKKANKWGIHPGFETHGKHHQKSKTGVVVAPAKDKEKKRWLKWLSWTSTWLISLIFFVSSILYLQTKTGLKLNMLLAILNYQKKYTEIIMKLFKTKTHNDIETILSKSSSGWTCRQLF